MSNCSPHQRGLNCLIHYIHHVGRAHDPLIISSDVHKQLVQIDILLLVGTDEIVEGVSGDREHWLSVALGVVEAVQQMNSARPRGGETNAQTPRELGITASGECGCSLVPHLNELQLV